MTRRTHREISESSRVSDFVAADVNRRIVIPPKFTDATLRINYFTPRFKKILKGEQVEWVNQDSKSHHLKFYRVDKNKVEELFDLGTIKPNSTGKAEFSFDFPRIDYLCALHNNEIGTIVIYPRDENQMSNTEQIRFLSKTFDIKPPAIWSHLGSQ